jgi:hypothetical protein
VITLRFLWARCWIWDFPRPQIMYTITNRQSQIENLKIWKFEDLKIWKFEDLKIRGFEDLRIWRFEDLRIWGFEDWFLVISPESDRVFRPWTMYRIAMRKTFSPLEGRLRGVIKFGFAILIIDNSIENCHPPRSSLREEEIRNLWLPPESDRVARLQG